MDIYGILSIVIFLFFAVIGILSIKYLPLFHKFTIPSIFLVILIYSSNFLGEIPLYLSPLLLLIYIIGFLALQKDLKRLRKILEEDGDYIKRKDEIGEIAKIFSDKIKKMEEVIRSLQYRGDMLYHLNKFVSSSGDEREKKKILVEFQNLLGFAIKNTSVFVYDEGEESFITKVDDGEAEKIAKVKSGATREEKIKDKNYFYFPLKSNGLRYATVILRKDIGNFLPEEREFIHIAKGIAEVILKRMDKEKQLESMSITDYLTGIYNRRYFIDRIEKEYIRFKRNPKYKFGIIMFDIDNFKKINDIYGHIVGDEILKYFARCCRNNVRGYDVPCRFGGDEFIILILFEEDKLDKKGETILEEITKRIVSDFQQQKDVPYLPQNLLDVTYSFGISSEALGTEELIKLVDSRLIQKKQKKKEKEE